MTPQGSRGRGRPVPRVATVLKGTLLGTLDFPLGLILCLFFHWKEHSDNVP